MHSLNNLWSCFIHLHFTKWSIFLRWKSQLQCLQMRRAGQVNTHTLRESSTWPSQKEWWAPAHGDMWYLVAPDLHIFRQSQNTNFPIKKLTVLETTRHIKSVWGLQGLVNLYFLCAFNEFPLTCLSHQSQPPKLPLIPIILFCYHFPFPNSSGLSI